MSDEQVKPLLNGSLKGLLDNTATFPKPPVDLAAYQAAIAAFEAAIQQQVDGSYRCRDLCGSRGGVPCW